MSQFRVCQLEFKEVQIPYQVKKYVLTVLQCSFMVHQYIWLSDDGGKVDSPSEKVLKELVSAALDAIVYRFGTESVRISFRLACLLSILFVCSF